MSNKIAGMLSACWGEGDTHELEDSLVWHQDVQQCLDLDVSVAVVQANEILEDQVQICTGAHGTYVGIYDGHGGPETSLFLTDHLFTEIERFANEEGGMSSGVLKKSFGAAEKEFLNLVNQTIHVKPHIATVGSCCLVGVIHGNRLYVANLGDSRAVLGTCKAESKGQPIAKRLCPEHNASNEEVRKELRAQHPDDPQIVMLKQGVWRVKGIIQVSRSIGDVYLKNPELNQLIYRPESPRFLMKPVLSAEPSIHDYVLHPQDQFLIFASDGLWEHLTDQQAINIVHNNPRTGIAVKLIREALRKAAKKREMRYSDLRKIERGVRRFFHDDISVVVVYLDSSNPNEALSSSPFASPCTPRGRRGGHIHTGGLLNAPRNVSPLLPHGFDNDMVI